MKKTRSRKSRDTVSFTVIEEYKDDMPDSHHGFSLRVGLSFAISPLPLKETHNRFPEGPYCILINFTVSLPVVGGGVI
jgi:hypothetical protein